ncbi:hypothetical protein LNV08_04600 [Paucibacter sp. TC2R-5]|uniref:hypothetical protein n=1 Tax=Paucibacter sp. TC2R-5 TaxID=2893555 RepID=UPI0021E4E53D|nr:hypothetical protein [Paucibacter sp. TC2R-5]MCV2358248.1 hypothetical protein [Paucibacter sp. TC2R-5]
MRFTLNSLIVSAALALSGCASYVPVPKDYSGPTAVLKDSGFSEDGTKAQIFAAMEIDGNRLENAFGATANASQGRGMSILTVFPERKVKAVPSKIQIRASHATGAPVAAIASQMAGTFFSVEGIIEFTPQAGGVYVVKGELKKEKSSVWIEDAQTGKPATVIVSK